jgi:hypothetical protein
LIKSGVFEFALWRHWPFGFIKFGEWAGMVMKVMPMI